MAHDARKERETRAVTRRRPTERLPRGGEIDRWFEDFWRRPFPSLWRPEHWWPTEAISMPVPAVDVYEEKDDVVSTTRREVPHGNLCNVDQTFPGSTDSPGFGR